MEEKARIAMTGDSLNFNLVRILQTMEPDLSGIAITNSGEAINMLVQEPTTNADTSVLSEPVLIEAGHGT